MHSSKHSHIKYLEDLLKVPSRNVLKISSIKVSIGNIMFGKDKRVCVKTTEERLKAKTTKHYKSFAGVANNLSQFCPNLQKLLQTIYDLTRKGRPFLWTKISQEAYKEIKSRLLKPPLLHLPDNTGRFQFRYKKEFFNVTRW